MGQEGMGSPIVADLSMFTYQSSALQNMEAWEEAKREIDKIEEHPNRLPDSVPPDPSPPKPRRDSTATVNGR